MSDIAAAIQQAEEQDQVTPPQEEEESSSTLQAQEQNEDVDEGAEEEQAENDEADEDDIDDERLNRILHRRGYAALPANEVARARQILQDAAGTKKETTSTVVAEEEDEDEDFDYLLTTNPKEAQQRIIDKATRQIVKQERLVESLIKEAREAVPELDDEDVIMLRANLKEVPVKALEQAHKQGTVVSMAKTYGYDKHRLGLTDMKDKKTPPKTPRVAERPKREAPAKPDAGKSSNETRFFEELNRVNRQDVRKAAGQ